MKSMNMNRIMTLISAFVCFSMLASGAGSCTGSEDSPGGYKLEEIKLSKTDVTMQVGDKVTVKAYAVPTPAVAPSFQWMSDNGGVATVKDGVIEAVAPGKAVITASCQGVVSTVNVIVQEMSKVDGYSIYDVKPNSQEKAPDLLLNGAGTFTDDGVLVSSKGKLVKLDRFYALGERTVRYEVRPSADAVMNFRSSEGDFNAIVDVPSRQIRIMSSPTPTVKDVPFLEGEKDYAVEVSHIYQRSILSVKDLSTGKSVDVSAVHDGEGGCGKGALQKGFSVGMHFDHYCFVLESGSSFLVRRMTVSSLKDDILLMLYGDSITQPEGYFPAKDFERAWTQQVISALGGNAMSSGRGGGTIDTVLEYIKNELPFIKTKYVMVTIGTNGGNTESKLTELVNYIRSCGAVPILNNIPSNESGTQIKENQLIDSVRKKFGIKGCMLDWATSVMGDGKEVNKDMMYWEDYTGSYGLQVYHHPNEKGGDAMMARIRLDLPELFQ